MAEDKIHFVKNSDLLDIAKKMKQDEEFNLSEKIWFDMERKAEQIHIENIKEFIKRYLTWLSEKHCHCETCNELKFKELAGDKLVV